MLNPPMFPKQNEENYDVPFLRELCYVGPGNLPFNISRRWGRIGPRSHETMSGNVEDQIVRNVS